MTTLIDAGWLYLSDGADNMKVPFKDLYYKYNRKPTVHHYAGGTSLSYDLDKSWLEIMVKRIFLTTYARFTTFVKYVNAWQVASGSFTVQIQKDTSTNYAELKGDGNGTSFSMTMKKGIQKASKLSNGDVQIWVVDDFQLEEGG